jgi:hypothetical protein
MDPGWQLPCQAGHFEFGAPALFQSWQDQASAFDPGLLGTYRRLKARLQWLKTKAS